jgi:membrane-bound inhibitor of C-type lysozyme
MMRKLFRMRQLWLISAVCLFLVAVAAALASAKPEEGEFKEGEFKKGEFKEGEFKKGELFLSAGGRDYILKHEDSVSGDKYTAKDDPTTFFWSGGKRALLTVGGRERTRYVLLRGLSDDDGFILTADGENYEMKPAVSASGAKYEAVGDPTTVFWSKGDSAFLTIKGKDYPGYETWAPDGVIWLPPLPQPLNP